MQNSDTLYIIGLVVIGIAFIASEILGTKDSFRSNSVFQLIKTSIRTVFYKLITYFYTKK